MKKTKAIVITNTAELAELLGLTPADAWDMELRSSLNGKIIEMVEKKGLTHAAVAKIAETSRTKITAIMNCNTKGISTNLLLRVLGALGVQAKVQFKEVAA